MRKTQWQPLARYCLKHKYKRHIPLDSSLHHFLRSNEWQHLHLSSAFIAQKHQAAKLQKGFSSRSSEGRTFVYSGSREGDPVAALLSWSEYGRLLFDCCHLRTQPPRPHRGHAGSQEVLPYLPLRELKDLLGKYDIRQFIGTYSHYEFLRHYHDFPADVQEYWIMLRNASHSLASFHPAEKNGLPSGLTLSRLDSRHWDQLFCLEQAYYTEEVPPFRMSPSLEKALRKTAAKRLENFLQYGVFAGKELVARAMINAYGLSYWQIGGIYTKPEWRRQGWANALLQKLCASIEAAGRLPVLFVRRENQAAMHLYENHVFERLERMVIAQHPR
ncbi:MAG: GNAT family N-acetyltransferase [Spirochaetota bacterium]